MLSCGVADEITFANCGNLCFMIVFWSILFDCIDWRIVATIFTVGKSYGFKVRVRFFRNDSVTFSSRLYVIFIYGILKYVVFWERFRVASVQYILYK